MTTVSVPPPHSVEAEQAVLGALLINPDEVLDEISPLLTPTDFYIIRHQWLYEAAQALRARNLDIDVVTLADELTRAGRLAEFGGVAYMLQLAQATPSSLAAASYARLVADYSHRRQLLDAAQRLARAAHTSGASFKPALSEAAAVVAEVERAATRQSRVEDMADVVADVLLQAELRAQTPLDVPGLETGLVPLDLTLGGLERGQLIYIAGRPGMGKSALLAQLAAGLAERGHRVLVFSLEMQRTALVRRMVCQRARLSYTAVQRGRLSQSELARFRREVEQMNTWRGRLFIEAGSGLTVAAMRAIADQVERRHGALDCVMIDTLNRAGDVSAARDQYHGMTAASHRVADWAHDSSYAVIAAAQLSRASQHAADKRPTLSDLRDSGALEEDADVVIGIHRPGYYERDKHELAHQAELLVLKHREGASDGLIQLYFESAWPGFARLAPTGGPEPPAAYRPQPATHAARAIPERNGSNDLPLPTPRPTPVSALRRHDGERGEEFIIKG